MSTSLLNRLRDTGPSISIRGNGRGGTQVEDALAQGRGVDTPGHQPRIHLPANEGRCVDERGGRPTPKNMTPKSFYPALTLSRIRAVEERVLRFLADVRLGRKRKRGQGDEESEALMRYWKQFSSQAAAFEEADRLDPTYQTLRTFSLQMTLSGTRKFLITSYIELWSRYALMPPRCRHFYEIVRENKPCHLYFDLEFDVSTNPCLDGQAAVDALLSLLDDFLSKNEILKKQLIPATRQIFELDSSSPQKFSRHLLIRFPGTAFKHNGHVGALVKHFADHVWTCASNDPRAAQLVVCKGQDQGHTLLIDTGVYSRNRAFRLFLSSKAGKEAILRSTGRYETAGLASEQLFMATLVGNVFPEALLVHYNLDGGETNSCPNPSRLSPPGAKSCSRRLNGKDLRPIQSTSPYPALDDFIKVASGGGIRSWMAIDDGVILYNIKDNRYCGNIGRQHRSNGVFYVVDLHHKVWYQKCHDPDCKTYRSPLSPLPPCLCDMVDNLPTFLGDCNGGGGDLGVESDDKEWEEAALQALIAVEQSAPLSPQLTADGLAA